MVRGGPGGLAPGGKWGYIGAMRAQLSLLAGVLLLGLASAIPAEGRKPQEEVDNQQCVDRLDAGAAGAAELPVGRCSAVSISAAARRGGEPAYDPKKSEDAAASAARTAQLLNERLDPQGILGGVAGTSAGGASRGGIDSKALIAARGKRIGTVPETPNATTERERLFSLASDAYGYTVTAGGRTQTFRDGKMAAAAIRRLPDGSISRIIFYGHGAPGSQAVGPELYDAESTA